MDWSKTKNVFIIIFFILNIFLFVQLAFSNYGNRISVDTVKNVKTVLIHSGVELKCDIPFNNKNIGMLNYGEEKYDRSKITKILLGEKTEAPHKMNEYEVVNNGNKKVVFKSDYKFSYTDENPSDEINMQNKKDVENYLRKLIDKMELPVQKYYLDLILNNSDGTKTYIFCEKFKNFPVFGNKLEFTVSEKGIKKLDCNVRKIKSYSDNNKRKGMPVYQLLLKNYTQGKKLAITSIELGFISREVEKGSSEMYECEVWRVRSEEQGDRYFQAYDGEEIKVDN